MKLRCAFFTASEKLLEISVICFDLKFNWYCEGKIKRIFTSKFC